jgi:hypothetical protein
VLRSSTAVIPADSNEAMYHNIAGLHGPAAMGLSDRMGFDSSNRSKNCDQQVAVLKRQSESSRVHYLEGQKVAARQASEASYQHQLLVTQVDKNTEQNGEIVSLLRELQNGTKGSSARAAEEIESCFEFAAKTAIDHKKSLGDCQNRYHQRHVEIREELHSLQAMVYSLSAHVQGLLAAPSVRSW